MKIRIIQIGKTKKQYLQDAEREYLKRIQSFADLEIITIKESGLNSNSESERKVAQIEEGKTIIENLKTNHFTIILDEKGQQFTSKDFASKIQDIRDFQGGKIDFIIGGSFGLSEEVKKYANLILSFSKFTFTHEHIRILLLEQIYRSFTIINNKTYHY